jgi:hypothetical protein
MKNLFLALILTATYVGSVSASNFATKSDVVVCHEEKDKGKKKKCSKSETKACAGAKTEAEATTTEKKSCAKTAEGTKSCCASKRAAAAEVK